MAQKVVKKGVSKGVRLGWSSLDEIQPVMLNSVVVKGKRINPVSPSNGAAPEDQNQTSFFIP